MSKIELAIKFGSNEITIYQKGIGIIGRQGTYLALSKRSKAICAYGSEAEKLCGLKKAQYYLYQPIKGIEIVDKNKAVDLLVHMLSRYELLRGDIHALVAVPCAMTEKKLMELKIVLKHAGVKHINFVQNAVCARINEFDMDERAECMVVDIGKYITDISVLSRFKFVTGRNYFLGGEEMDNSLVTYIADNYDLSISKESAESIKNEVASLYENDMYTTNFEGITKDSKYSNVAIRANEVRVAIVGVYDKIFDLINEVLQTLPSETLASVKQNGVIFTGGVSCADGFGEYAIKKLNMPVIISNNPQDAVVSGAGKLLNLELSEFPHIDI